MMSSGCTSTVDLQDYVNPFTTLRTIPSSHPEQSVKAPPQVTQTSLAGITATTRLAGCRAYS
jgi:hypothetical protein